MKSLALPLRNERGIALVAALVIMALLIVLGTIALNATVSELQVSGNELRNRLAFYAAESGAQFARSRIRDEFAAASNQVSFVTNFASDTHDFTPPSGYAFSITPGSCSTVGSGTAADPYCFLIESTGTATGNASATIEVMFHLEVSEGPLTYAGYGKSSISIAKDSIIDAYDSSTGSVVSGAGDLISGGDVDLGKDVVVDGDVTENATTVASDPLGLLTSGGVLDTLFDAAIVSNMNADVAISPYVTGTVLNIPSTAAGSVINLAPGDYYFTSISIAKDITINISGPGEVNIYLDGKMDVKKTININTSGVPTDFSIFSKSSQSITFNKSTDFNGLIYAPNADVDFKMDATVKGAVWADDLWFRKDADLSYDVNMKDKFGSSSGALELPIVSWREI